MSGAQPAALAKGVGRAFAGALLFSLPILMTMEMWQLGVSVDRWRLALLLVTTAALTVAMESYFGMRKGRTAGVVAPTVDAGIAFLVGLATAALVLTVLSVVQPVRTWDETLSIVAIQALPATLGASFARSQLGDGAATGRSRPSYRQELFLMLAGAVVFSANISPTEEIVLLAGMLEPGHAVALVALELAVMHGFVYGVDFAGGSDSAGGFWRVFLLFTVVGYVIALAVSAYLLWTFGRFDGTGLHAAVTETVVLALPTSVGAAAARLIL